MPPGLVEGIAHKTEAYENTGQKTGQENLGHGYIHDEGVKDHGNTRGDKDPQGTGGCQKTDGETLSITFLYKGRHHDASDGDDGSR